MSWVTPISGKQMIAYNTALHAAYTLNYWHYAHICALCTLLCLQQSHYNDRTLSKVLSEDKQFQSSWYKDVLTVCCSLSHISALHNMAPRRPKPLIEETLFSLVKDIDNFKLYCPICTNVEDKVTEDYLHNTITKTKLYLVCHEHASIHVIKLSVLQDRTRIGANPYIDDVTPNMAEDSAIRVYNIALYVKGKTIKLLLVADKPYNGWKFPPTNIPEEESNTGNDLTADPESITTRLSQLCAVDKESMNVTLSGADHLILLESGLAEMDIAIEAVETAFTRFRVMVPQTSSEKIKGSIRAQAVRLRNSAKAVWKLAESCKEEGKVMDKYALPGLEKHVVDGIGTDGLVKLLDDNDIAKERFDKI